MTQTTTADNTELSWWQHANVACCDGLLAQALVYFKLAREAEPDSSWTHQLEGELLSKLRRFEEALHAFQKVKLSRDSRLENRHFWSWGDFYTLQGKHREAEEWYRKLVDKDTNHTAPYIILGSCLRHQGKHEEAIEVYKKARQLPGDPDEAYLNMGFVLRAQGHFQESALALRQALALCPEYPVAEAVLADVEAAIALMHEVRCEELSDVTPVKVPRDDFHGMYLDNYASMSRVHGPQPRRIREAISTREERFNKEAHVSQRLWWDRAVTCGASNTYAQGLVSIERRLAIDADHFTLLLHGMILTDLCRFEEARVALNRAQTRIKTIPKHIKPTHMFRAWANFYREQGNLDEEELWWRQVAAVEPEQAATYIDLGSCLSRQGRLAEAEVCFRHSATLADEVDVAWLRLGLVLRSQERFAEAAEALERATNVDPEYDAAKAALADVTGALQMQREVSSVPL